jgi:aspartyl aminopeptidase
MEMLNSFSRTSAIAKRSNQHTAGVLLLAPLFLFCIQCLTAQSVWQKKSSGWMLLTDAQHNEVFAFSKHYKNYLRQATTGLTSTKEVIQLAKAAGFKEFSDASQVKPGARLIVNNRDNALAMIAVGSEPITKGSHLVGTHHDSPRIDVKARPAYEAYGYVLFKTTYHGGIKKYQWANIPLMLTGRIVTKEGKTIDVSLGGEPEDPVFLIADLAPHVDAQLRNRTYTNVFEGEEMNPIMGSVPDEKGSVFNRVLRFLSEKYGINEEDFISADLSFVPANPPRDEGFDRGLTAAYGQDDRLSSYVAARSIMYLKETPKFTAIAYLTDNEETGSNNNTGASSAFITVLYGKLVSAQRGRDYADLDTDLALRNTIMISADVTDGVNPIFPGVSEMTNAAKLGYGVTIKRYGRGTDPHPEVLAQFRRLLDDNRIPWQTETYKVDVGGGGSIGGLFSQRNMEVIDIGVPVLSMHSPYELSSKVDVWNFYRFMTAFYGSQ